MKFIVALVGQVKEFSGRSTGAKLIWFVAMAYGFLWVPDIDLVFLSILHHRSIVTHSIFPALVLLLLGKRAGAAPLAGALIGLAVHLSCDMLSPMVGFAQVWLPAPIKAPLGPLSYPWLFANALCAFWIARKLAMVAFNVWTGYSLMILVSVVTALSYGVLNENSVLSAATTLTILFISVVGARKSFGKIPEAATQMKARSKSGISLSKRATTEIEKLNAGMSAISESIQRFTDDLSLRKSFLSQKWALEATLSTAKQIIEHEREIENEGEAFKAIYAKVREGFHGDKEVDNTSEKYLEIDLLSLSPDQVLPRQAGELKRLKEEHRLSMQKIKAELLADTAVHAKFTQLLLERGGQDRLAQILNLNSS